MEASVQIEAISHVAIAVTDLQRSLSFYRDVLGLEQDGSEFAVDDDTSAALYELDRDRGKHSVAAVRCGNAHIDLVRFDDVDTNQQAVPADHVGLSHVGFWVSSVDALYEKLSSQGVKFLIPPSTTPPQEMYGGPVRITRFLDPDGTVIEVYNRL
jgi:glyoxylase I family protein